MIFNLGVVIFSRPENPFFFADRCEHAYNKEDGKREVRDKNHRLTYEKDDYFFVCLRTIISYYIIKLF